MMIRIKAQGENAKPCGEAQMMDQRRNASMLIVDRGISFLLEKYNYFINGGKRNGMT